MNLIALAGAGARLPASFSNTYVTKTTEVVSTAWTRVIGEPHHVQPKMREQ
jgi:hypothetical protein